jgi:uncharacterized membrane-anchored protein YhcB (DUF1043 family)
MSFTDVLPVIIVVVIWVAIGLIIVAFFRRSLRIPTESEIELQHEQAESPEHSADKTPAATH